MARTVAQINALMVADVQADPVLSILIPAAPKLPSKRSFWGAVIYIFATATFILEGLMDVFKDENEAIAASAAPASAGWLQAQVLKFQYDPVIPQIVQLINFAPAYPTVDPTKQIISRCAVVTTVSGQTLIKVATGEPPEALSSGELSALQDYVDDIGATINYICNSAAADELYIAADIYYAGQYSAIIGQAVIDAINNFLSTFSLTDFNGSGITGAFKVSDIEATIRAVPGVNDCVLKNIIARADGTPFIDGTYLVQDGQQIARTWSTVAGYIISETTSGQTLADSLTFIAQ